MKVKKRFVSVFLIVLILTILSNIIMLVLNSLNFWLVLSLIFELIFLLALILRALILRKKLNRFLTLFFVYGILICSVIVTSLFEILNIESVFLFFIFAGFLCYFFDIDSRYLILPAILSLWLCPFLLVYELESLAETVAIYVYYFLVVGVILQFIEFKLDYKFRLEFEKLKVIFTKFNLFLGLFWLVFFSIFHFLKFEKFTKAISLYLGVTFIIIYLVGLVLNENR